MRFVVIPALAVLLFAPALAGEEDWEDCKSDNHERSIAGCTRVITEAKDPESILAIAYNNRAIAYKARGEILRAFADYTEALRLDPSYARAYYNRGLAYLSTGNSARALDDFDAALRIQPNFAKALANRALLLAEHDEIEEALADFAKLLAIDANIRLPSNPDLAAKIVAGVARRDQLIVALGAALKLNSEDPELYNSRGALHLESKAFAAAIADFAAAIRLSPENSQYLSNRCRAYLEAGQLQPAFADCDEAIRAAPTNGNAYLARGMINLRRSKMQDAERDFTRAIELIPDALRPYLLRAQTYEKLAQPGKAIVDYQSVTARQPKGDQDRSDKEAAQSALLRLAPPPSPAPAKDKDAAQSAMRVAPPPAADDPLLMTAAKCDEKAAFRFDPDRPASSKWQDSYTKIDPLSEALGACETAIRLTDSARSPDAKLLRRLTLELGRVHAAKAYAEVVSGDRTAAQGSFAKALELWNKAIRLGSSQAILVVGSYYAGAFAISEAKPDPFVPLDTPNLPRAWSHYEQAARMKNPFGLANAGLILLGIDTRDWKLQRDEKRGREYLEEAVRMEVPPAYYGLGLAMLQGMGNFPKNSASENEGIRLLSVAYCKEVTPAVEFFERSRKYKKPAQCTN